MDATKHLRVPLFRNEELIFSVLLTGIAVTAVFWTLLNSLFSLALLIYWLLFATKEFSWKSPKSRWVVLMALFYTAAVVGALYSANRHEALFKLQQKSALLLFPVVFGTSSVLSLRLLKRTLNAFAIAVVAGCVLCYAMGVFSFLRTGQPQDLYGYSLVRLKDMTPFVFGLYCLIALLHLWQQILVRQKKMASLRLTASTIRELLGIFLLFLFLLALGNRTILILSIGLTVFYCLKILPALKHKILLIAGIVGLTTVALLSNPYLKKQGLEMMDFSSQNAIQLNQDSSLGKSWGGKQLREAIWKCSWDVVRNHWAFGVGTGDTQDSLQAAYEKRKFYFASRYNQYNTHNQYLQETVTLGVWGLLIFLACLITPLFVRFDALENLFYGLFVLGFLFSCITDTPFDINKGIILYAFFNALIFFTYYNCKFKSIHATTQSEF